MVCFKVDHLRFMRSYNPDASRKHADVVQCENCGRPTELATRQAPPLFNLTDSLRSRIDRAQKTHVAINSGLDFATMEYTDLTRGMIKRAKVSPDSVMQLAIQMAFYSLYKEMVPTYESCSTSAFLKGRTDCMRSATAATKEAVLAILDRNVKNAEKLIVNCSNTHGQLVKEASMGQAFDRHLLGLKISAERLKMPTPALFEDVGFIRMGHFVLSTSTLSTNTIVFGGYTLIISRVRTRRRRRVHSFLVIDYSSSKFQKNRDAKEFSEALVKSLDTLRNILHKG
ncbi:unnamed protein product [Heligmosomoides polygyrus]|uniref:Choline/carnitine acyltransferase domain-containing protein n=1 Tax=Heligmosomoides polygyrus TaxID=6339 RepID=A0A3P8BS34_HELPZ|nr:unnamed protein product [Heligmosomoides polygyrus]